ncbi:MAG: anion permease [Eggerthellaceae bacterium]|nr:anion permease [Eggerthellaceae bacterium]
MLDRLIRFLRDEAVLCIAFICAVASIVSAGDVSSVPSYIDWRVIVLLFCLMASVAGLSASGVMTRIAQALVAGEKARHVVCTALIMLPFFASMLITNDVALLTFVPIAILALEAAGWRDSMVRVIVLQAIAANLGGMVTPVGNPQNLFIFTAYDLTAGDFFAALAPFGVLALVMLAIAGSAFGSERSDVILKLDERAIDLKRFTLHAALFVLSVLSVLHVVPYIALLLVVAAALFVFDRRVFGRIDYALLATFACFFIFSGNMAHMPAMQEFLGGLMQDHPMLTSLITSQVISNVPASVLLAGFTENWHSLLIGVDLGGLGTPIASLASLIAFRLYMHTQGARGLLFMRDFAIANAVTLACMVALYAVLYV